MFAEQATLGSRFLIRSVRISTKHVRPGPWHPLMESEMRKYLIAAVLVVSTTAPAFANSIYVMLDMRNQKCITSELHSMKHFKMLGKYPTLGEAETAMHTMTQCK